ncbi:MAG: class I SAM-dependent methyltransferase [Gemmatimonadales bacterium]
MRALYSGDVEEIWARIERETPATYWEENAVLGRVETYRALRGRLQPLEGRRILDGGCGRGLLARRLSSEGALVTGADVLFGHVSEARKRVREPEGGPAPRWVVADFRDLLLARGAFDDLVLQEVVEDYGEDERVELFRGLAGADVPRLHVIFRRTGSWGSLVAPLLPSALVTALDPVTVLRSIHRHTPYRLSHQESVRRRSYHVQLVELTLGAESSPGDP